MGAGSADGGLLGSPSGLSGVAGGGRHDAGTATFNPDDSMAPQLLVIFLTTSLTSATPKHLLRNAIQSIVSTAGATDCWMCILLNSSTRLGIEFVPLNLNDWWDKSNIFWWGPVWFDDSNVHSYLRCGPWGSCCDRDWAFLPSDIFAGLKIDPKTLVKKLDLDSRSFVSTQTAGCFSSLLGFLQSSMTFQRGGKNSVSKKCMQTIQKETLGSGGEEKSHLSKREKMKLRKEQWLQKIEGVKLARQKQKAKAKRKATPVVGDMQPLMEALPELSELTTTSKGRKHPKIQARAKAEPTDFSQMKPAQKRRLLQEEVARFHKVIANPVYKANPLGAISEHLCKRLKQEEGNAI
ncbi:ribosome biogenesis protein SLX9 homolog isoform X2 [Carettochelys insculpta]|uniref:ribosome biogenesis protein SLX9 homolog isoform X2 n=1 Tax=Carettochelys insculpta TaxID=44489 RepID=UPI003EBAE5AA